MRIKAKRSETKVDRTHESVKKSSKIVVDEKPVSKLNLKTTTLYSCAQIK